MAKKFSSRKSFGLWIGFAAFIVIVLICFLRPKPQPSFRPLNFSQQQLVKIEEPWLVNFWSVGNKILSAKPDDKWLIETEEIPRSSVEVGHRINLGKRITEQIEFGLQRNSSIPEVVKLKRLFAKQLLVTFFSNSGGGMSGFLSTDKKDADGAIDPNSQEVVIFGRWAKNHPYIRDRMLYYNQSWQSLMVAAIDWDPVWLEAVSLHELFHARLYREGVASTTAPGTSDLWIQEEVAAHNLEHDILNLRTKGKYNAVLKKILSAKTAISREDLMLQVTAEDMKQLDGLFVSAGHRATGIRLTQFWLSLMNGWVDRQNFTREEILPQQIVNYRLLVSTAR